MLNYFHDDLRYFNFKAAFHFINNDFIENRSIYFLKLISTLYDENYEYNNCGHNKKNLTAVYAPKGYHLVCFTRWENFSWWNRENNKRTIPRNTISVWKYRKIVKFCAQIRNRLEHNERRVSQMVCQKGQRETAKLVETRMDCNWPQTARYLIHLFARVVVTHSRSYRLTRVSNVIEM